jgi:hypothetical protein
VTYYAEADLNRVKNEQAHRPLIPEYPGFMCIEEACAQLGVCDTTLRRWLKAKKVAIIKKSAKRINLRAGLRGYVLQSTVKECAAEARKPLPAGRITVRQAAEILGISKDRVHALITRGILDATPGEILDRRANRQSGLLLSQTAVEDYRAAKKAKYGKAAHLGRLAKAVTVLRDLLADGKPHLRAEVFKEAVKRGVPHDYIWLARKKLQLICERPNGYSSPGFWRLLNGAAGGQEWTAGDPPPLHGNDNSKPTDEKESAKRRKRRGRPKGWRDPEVAARQKAMLEAWDRGEFGTNKAAAGRAFEFDRSDAAKIIKDHERSRCRK